MVLSLIHLASIVLSLAAAALGGPLQPLNVDLSSFSIIRPPLGSVQEVKTVSLGTATTLNPTAVAGPASAASNASAPQPGPPTADPSVNLTAPAQLSTDDTCDVEKFLRPSRKAWQDAKTDQWLDSWWASNNGSFGSQGGLVSVLGEQYLRRPDLSCAQLSSAAECDFSPCKIAPPANTSLALAGQAVQSPYYVLESIKRLHGFFSSLSETLQSSAIGAALAKDNWAYVFYTDKDAKDVIPLKLLLTAVAVVVCLAAVMAGPLAAGVLGASAGAMAGIATVTAVESAAGASAALAEGAVFGAMFTIKANADDTPQKAAGVGGYLGRMFMSMMQQLLQANFALMKGEKYGNSDLRNYVAGGHWVDYPGMNESSVLYAWNNLLTAAAINQLYKVQKVFIVGGGPCDDSGGIGQGPQEAKFCREGKAWYLYYWKEPGGKLVLGKAQWGHVDKPPGFDQLGQNEYRDITPQAIINSSINAFLAAGGNNYTSEFARTRVQSAMSEGWSDPVRAGINWEGIFNIPVCDVSGVVPQKDWRKKSVIQQPYGKGKIPTWCGPVCGQSQNETDTFIEMANMKNFKSIRHYC